MNVRVGKRGTDEFEELPEPKGTLDGKPSSDAAVLPSGSRTGSVSPSG